MLDKTQRDWVVILSMLENDSKVMDWIRYCPFDILRYWQFKRFNDETVIFQQGQVYNDFHLILEGCVDVFVEGADGRKYSQAQYHYGDMIGELEVFERKPYLCNVRAVGQVSLLSISREHFIRWLELDGHFSLKIMHRFSQLYYNLAQKSAEDSLYSLQQRVCLFLLKRIDLNKHDNIGQPIEIRVHKQQLSDQLSVTLRSINRTFAQLRQSGIIQIDEDRITILDRSWLEQQVRS